MTLNNRMAYHRLLKRQGVNLPSSSNGPSDTTTSTSPTVGPDTTGSSTSSSSTTFTDTASTRVHKPSSATSQSSTAVTTTSSSTDSTSSPTSTSSSTTSSVTTVPSESTATPIPVVATTTAPAVTETQLPVPSTFSTSLPSSTVSPSTTASTSHGVSTGVIVGSVAGAIIGLAFLAMIIAFFLRRWRRRDENLDLDFNPADFVSPTTEYPAARPISTFDPSPPSMTQRDRDSALGPGMAGYGAYPYAAGAGATLHERHQYVYGAQTGMREDDPFGGPYSSQPQPQSSYNPEAYGSYAHPSTDNYGSVSNPPALVPGAHAVPANRGTRSMDNEDAYGGF